MIIEAPYKQNDTITVRTTAGEELVCRYVEEDTNSITVQKPMAVMVTQQGIGLGPFTFSVDPSNKFKLSKSAILFIHKTEQEIGKQYIQSTTGIAI